MAGRNPTSSREMRRLSSVQLRCPAAIWWPAPSIGPSSRIKTVKNGSSMAIWSRSDQANSSPLRTSLPRAVRNFVIAGTAPLRAGPRQRGFQYLDAKGGGHEPGGDLDAVREQRDRDEHAAKEHDRHVEHVH